MNHSRPAPILPPRTALRSSSASSNFHAVVLLLALAMTGCDRSDEGTAAAGGEAKANRYTFGTEVKAGTDGDFQRYAVSGWSNPEEQFTWTEGDTAVLAVRVPASQSGVALKVRANGFIHQPDLPAQPVEVLVNGTKVADWQVGETAEHSAILPPEMVKDGGLLTITFKMPKATSPKAVGKNEDSRVLGICVWEFEVREVG